MSASGREVSVSAHKSFSEFMEIALYGPGGFYQRGRGAGRGGRDFITSPEVGPLFGAVMANALDTWWEQQRRPDPFCVFDLGAGPGTLVRSIARAEPACSEALRLVMIELGDAQRETHGDYVELADLACLRTAGGGPAFVSLSAMPEGEYAGVVIANELMDNLPADLFERGADRWYEVRVELGTEDTAIEVLVAATDEQAAWADRVAPGAPIGGRVPCIDATWLARAQALVPDGRVVAVDYCSTSPELASQVPAGWLRTFAGQNRGIHPTDAVGSQDITYDVPVDQLPTPAEQCSQAAFLAEHGIEDLVAEGRRVWHERAHLGDLQAIAARSRIVESEALLDADGLGGFQVLEWAQSP